MRAVQVRAADFGDRAELAAIMAEVFLADQARYVPEPLDPDFVRRYSEDLAARPWAAMALATVDGRAAGMTYVEGAKIEALNVVGDWRRCGVGSALLAWAEALVV